jgi:hypothetical protein
MRKSKIKKANIRQIPPRVRRKEKSPSLTKWYTNTTKTTRPVHSAMDDLCVVTHDHIFLSAKKTQRSTHTAITHTNGNRKETERVSVGKQKKMAKDEVHTVIMKLQ